MAGSIGFGAMLVGYLEPPLWTGTSKGARLSCSLTTVQIVPHTLFSLALSSVLDSSYHQEPVKLFKLSGLNAWDTQRITDSWRDSPDVRHQYAPMPPLSGVTVGHPNWLPEEEYRVDDNHGPLHPHEPNQVRYRVSTAAL